MDIFEPNNGIETIPSPLGKFQATWTLNGLATPWPVVSRVDALTSHVVWQSPQAAQISFEWGRIPTSYEVSDCWAGIWRVEAQQVVTGLRLTFQAPPIGPEWEGGHNSGEHLVAARYSDPTTNVSIGTADLEILQYRVSKTLLPPLPDHWKEPLSGYSSPFEPYLASTPGMIWDLPTLNPNDSVEFHVIIAWDPDPDSVISWLAVDEPILNVKTALYRSL
ncbi:hypothetical protein G7068_02100 [Leucobacter viscericola]|uniref:Uncharacterized protein n=1 Tax=Leucobacter viscericola TaxID=2714935 RepID=A0A6G7XCD1_9MICO|nr:hypothetical protein [Leucobacter viscericola]QIK62126.1 hypothetical protein G7068_02100 [Leucobacter viscericola]